MPIQTSDNKFGVAKWIVDPTAGLGTHTTIASALTSASSNDTIFIRPGTYTENLTLKAGVNLTAFICDALTPNVIILGKATLSTAGTVTLSGIQLKTNGDYLLVVSGNVASIINLTSCYINCADFDGISFTSSDAASRINIDYGRGNLGTAGKKYFVSSSAGTLFINNCNFANSIGSTAASTISAGTIDIQQSFFTNAITTTGTSTLYVAYSTINIFALNTICFTIGGSGNNNLVRCDIESGTASAISVSTTVNIYDTLINSSNASSVTGAGTATFTNISEVTGTALINPTTVAAYLSRFGGITTIAGCALNSGVNPIDIGTDAVAKTVTIGTTTGASIMALKFGTGDFTLASATGTVINANDTGEIVEPLQSAFGAYMSASAANVTGNSAPYDLVFNAEYFDQNADFNTGTGIFTAPVTGKYLFNVKVIFQEVAVTGVACYTQLVTTATTFDFSHISAGICKDTYANFGTVGSVIAVMTAGDTAKVTVSVVGMAGNTVDVGGFFSGMLEC